MFSRRDKLSSGYRFNVDEILLLETVFTYNPRPLQVKIRELANKLGVSEKKVYTWFANKRFHLKKETSQLKQLDRKYLPSYSRDLDFHLFLALSKKEHDLL